MGGGLALKIMYLFIGNIDKMLFQVMMNDHVVIVHTVTWDLSDFRLNLYFVLHFVLLLFCVLTCVTLGNAAALMY
jgi:hypothetical protein